MKKTLTALVLAAGMAFPNLSGGITIGPDLLPVTDGPAAGKIERKGREMVERGVDYSPRFDCLMELVPYTTYALEISPADTYNDIISFFRERGVTYDHLEELKNSLQARTNLSSWNQVVEPYLWGTNVWATHFDCPERVPPIPTEIEGIVTSATLTGEILGLTLAGYDGEIILPRALRISAGESIKLYRKEGFTGDILDIDKLEIIGIGGRIKFSYQP